MNTKDIKYSQVTACLLFVVLEAFLKNDALALEATEISWDEMGLDGITIQKAVCFDLQKYPIPYPIKSGKLSLWR